LPSLSPTSRSGPAAPSMAPVKLPVLRNVNESPCRATVAFRA